MNFALDQSAWQDQWRGYGQLRHDPDGIRLYPQPNVPGDADFHSALTLSNEMFHDFSITVVYVVEAQIKRIAPPDPWEVFWLFFNYQPTPAVKQTNYFCLKMLGCEVGAAWDVTEQISLVTPLRPSLQIGFDHTITVTRLGPTVEVTVDGDQALVTSDDQLFDQYGYFGLYSEQSNVWVKSVEWY